MDLAYLFRVLLKRKWIIIGSAVLAALVAWFLTRNQPKIYSSNARFSTGYAVPDEIRVNENNYSLYDADVKFNNAINTWTSPSVVSLLGYTLMLHDLGNPDAFRRLTAAQKASAFYKSIDQEAARKVFEEKLETMSVLTSYKPEERDLLEYMNMYGYSYKYLSQAVNVYQVQRTDYIQVDSKTENPELSAFIVNNLFEQFIRYYRNIRSTKSQESIDTLQSIMEKKKQEWEDKNKLVSSEGGEDLTSQNQSNTDLIAEFERSLSDEKSKQIDYNYQLRRVNQKLDDLNKGTSGTKGSGTGSGSDNNNNNEELIQARNAMNAAYSEYLKTNDKNALARYNQLKQEYYSKYRNSAAITAQTTGPDGKNDLLEKKNDLEVSIQASQDKIRDLDSKIASLKANVSSTSGRNANVENLMQEAKMAEKEYFDAKQRYTAALDIGSSSVNNFRQLQVAQPAIEPEPSKRAIIVGMAGVVTFMTSILVILFLTYLDSSIRTPGIFSRVVGLRLISMVNFMSLKDKPLKELITGELREDVTRGERSRDNIFRESIRKLRYEIEHSGGKRIFLFTSTQKGQGKTTLVMAVSFSLCMSRKKILIIDTNFSNNDLTVSLHAEPILEKISGQNTSMSLKDKIDAFSKGITIEPGGGKLYIIGSQGGDYTPSEILPRENLLTNLPSLLAEFDYIFLEGPPLNDFSDSRELVDYVDGVVAVFSATHIVKQMDKESVNFFKDLNGKFCGSVLNMVDLENVNTI